MTPPRVSPHDLVARLSVLRGAADDAVLAFDADGTIWSGDVGFDVFGHFADEDLFESAADEPLVAAVAALGLGRADSAREAARSLLDATLGGFVERLPAYEAMTWALCGYRPETLRGEIRHALEPLDLSARRQEELAAIFDFAKSADVRTIVVSASPRLVVEEALSLVGISVDVVVGGEAAVDDGVLQPRMAVPLPYGDSKTEQAAAHVGSAAWLASFGDSDYDLPMLRAAKLGVLVRPKPSLRALAANEPHVVELLESGRPAT